MMVERRTLLATHLCRLAIIYVYERIHVEAWNYQWLTILRMTCGNDTMVVVANAHRLRLHIAYMRRTIHTSILCELWINCGRIACIPKMNHQQSMSMVCLTRKIVSQLMTRVHQIMRCSKTSDHTSLTVISRLTIKRMDCKFKYVPEETESNVSEISTQQPIYC